MLRQFTPKETKRKRGWVIDALFSTQIGIGAFLRDHTFALAMRSGMGAPCFFWGEL